MSRLPQLLSVLLFAGAFLQGCSHSLRPLTAEELSARETTLRELLEQGTRALRRHTPNALDEADAAFKLAAQVRGDDARVFDGLGCATFQRGDLENARRYFRRAIELNREYDRPVAHLAAIAEARGEHRVARLLLERALRMNPLNFRARNNYAVLLETNDAEQQRGYQELLKAYQAAGPIEELLQENIRVLRSEHQSARDS